MNIADRIKRLRQLFNITSNDLAEITDIHPVSIRKYETNKMVPGIDVIDKMCNALKLPRMIFEGFPKQHTDYKFTGDFYQQLLLLLDNQTLSANKVKELKNNESDIYFSINPELKKYIKVKYNGQEIPLSDITINIDTKDIFAYQNYSYFSNYLDYLSKAKWASETDNWTDTVETREEYIARMLSNAEQAQFDLMLLDHSWKQYYKGTDSNEAAELTLDNEILSGGNFYTYVDKLDVPETEKKQMILSFEEKYISELLDIGNLSDEKSIHARLAKAKQKVASLDQFKKEHPDYKELCKKHAEEIAIKTRKEHSKKSSS